MLVTTIGKVRRLLPDTRFVIHSYFPLKDREICKDPGVEVVDAAPLALVTQYFPVAMADAVLRLLGLSLPGGWMPRNVRALKESRVLLDLFGVSFSDGREKFLPFNVLSNWPAMLLGTPVVKLSQGLGSFKHPATRWVGRWMLRKCAKVYARGSDSFRMAEHIGVGEPLDCAPDVAFGFEDAFSVTSENTEYECDVLQRLREQRGAGRRILVLSVSAVVHKKCRNTGIDYPAAMARIAEHFVGCGHTVVLFPNATREGVESLHNNDLPILVSIADQTRTAGAEDRLIPIARDLNTASLRHVLAETDWLVASRFHAMIAGLSLGMPTMVLGWGHKYREVLAQFEIQENAYDYSELQVQSLVRRIEAFIAKEDDIRARMARNIDRVQTDSDRQFAWLADFLAPEGDCRTYAPVADTDTNLERTRP